MKEHGYKLPLCKSCQCMIGISEVGRSLKIGRNLYCDKCRPTPRALDAANVCRVINHFYVDGVCSQCGSKEPPRK